MMRSLIHYYFLLCSTIIFAQHHTASSEVKVTLMNYKSYKEYKKLKDNKIDSLGFSVEKGDTIIQVRGYEIKGVQVAYEEKDSIFLERYKQLVFNKKYQKKENKLLPRMRTWKNEIKIYFDQSVNTYNKKKLTDFLQYIDKEVDSLKISFVKIKNESNYLIYSIESSNDVNLDPRILNKEGYYLQWNGKQNIYACSLKINNQLDLSKEEILTNTKILLVKSLGYFYNDYDNSNCTSYLSACKSDNKEFDERDLEILKYHYSYGICKGSDIETFEKNHKDAQDALKRGSVKMYFIHQK